jgi:predicted Zn-dependent peptidase
MMRRLPTAILLVMALEPAALCGWIIPATGSPAPCVDAAADSLRSLIVATQPWRTVVTVVLSFPTGSAGDRPGREGSHWLLASLLEEAAKQALAGTPATARVEAGRTTTTVTLLAAPDGWAEGYGALREVLYRRPLEEGGLERAKKLLRARHRFEAGAPIRDFQREIPRLITDTANPWSRPPEGREEALDSIDLETLEVIRRGWLRPDSAVGAVAGPVTKEAVYPWLAGTEHISPTESRAEGVDSTRLGAAPPWTTGQRVEITRDVANSWIALAFPVDPMLPRTRLELLAHTLLERLHPSPPDPGALDVQVYVHDPPGGSVLLVTAAILPDAAHAWEERALEVVEALRSAPTEELLFRALRRRFRSRALLAESAPEEAAVRWLTDTERGAVRSMVDEIWLLTPESLQAAAAALGQPRVLVFGPDLSAGSGHAPVEPPGLMSGPG